MKKYGKTKLRNGTKVKQNRQWTYNATLRCVHLTVSAFANLHANRIFYAPNYIFICGCVALPYFPTLSHKWQDFLGEKCTIEHKM
jgi:hypothetical protein